MDSRPTVVFLAYLPYGTDLSERFMRSYREHDAGLPHDMLVIEKGPGLPLVPEFETMSVPDDRLDLGTYIQVVRNYEAPRYLFLNTSCVILADGWLEKLNRHLGGDVGMVGVSGSHGEAVDKSVLFPNPHLRTAGFMLEREMALDLDWHEPILEKQDAYDVENGPRSLTTQVRDRGLEVMVVGRDGEGYPVARWPESNTFWSGQQENTLIADRGSLRYTVPFAGLHIPEYRVQRQLCKAAWGTLDPWHG